VPFSLSFGLPFGLRKRRVALKTGVRDTGATGAAGFGWVDAFIARVRPYIFVRTEDNILIKRPNNAVKLNATGALILKSLLDGMTVNDLAKKLNYDRIKIAESVRFITTVKQHLDGTLDPLSCNPSVSLIPFDMKFSAYPVLSEIALTYGCNLSCRFCYAGCGGFRRRRPAPNEMTVAEAKTIIGKLYNQAKVPSVSFTGGEPTLVPRLAELIAFAKKTGMRVNLISNGTLIDERYARALADSGLDSAQISLEAPDASTHDAMVGVPGAFEKTVQAVLLLKACGIAVHTNTTVTRMNQRSCAALPRFVKHRLGCDKFSMNMMIPVGNGADDDSLKMTYEAMGPFITEMIGLSGSAGVEFMWYSPLPMCIFNTVAHGLGNKGCAACDGLISVAANGDVLPCASCDDGIGNLLRSDFKDLWAAPKAHLYRSKGLAHDTCKLCENFHICNGACPLYWKSMGFSELERHSSAMTKKPCAAVIGTV
jgi:radical SAM protein with 4Fe4S-binding SPASM domain